ncbi:SDR family NAD(P)-dependent oxidoreductase [Roseospirillum parvum]|uniref:Short-chain dehydrogenase n=1 Tax=Roseospirillum parvum TaxID=83401 RepID=A0A1G8AS83_9PROT|nr:SDR family NAD(P)-dependent oxidoreductase [Roseospirillum parvum]SDH23779.1 Short-chain dehydrogenase [Roseospirillum parvum]
MPRRPPPRSVLITGASSGIGAALAEALAGPGVRLALGGRDAARLAEVAERVRARGGEPVVREIEVTEPEAMAAWIAEAEAARPLDMVIANAGVSGGTAGAGESAAQTRRLFAVNVDGVLNTVLPVLEPMRARRAGQIVLVSSLAGWRGVAGAPAYSATKAAVKAWGEGLRGWLAADGVGVSVVMPGFVESRMTAVNDFPMPLLMPAGRAAAIIVEGLARDKGRIAFPWPLAAAAWFAAALPEAVVGPLMRRLPRKG